MGDHKKNYHQVNHFIKVPQVRVVGADGSQVGVMDTNLAIEMALEQDLDLVMVAPRANPPVTKIVSFAKFKYEQKQKNKSGLKTTKSVDIKEIRLTPFIAKGDFDNRMKKARRFLEDGNKVKLNVKFTGRQITRKEFGDRIINQAIVALGDLSTIEREPQLQGKVLSAQLQPKKSV